MALIHCPECGKEISGEAEACPICGKPIPKQGKPFYKQGFFWLIVILIIIMAVIFYGKIATDRHLSETVENAFYESGKGGTKISDLTNEFEKQMESFSK